MNFSIGSKKRLQFFAAAFLQFIILTKVDLFVFYQMLRFLFYN